MREIEEMLKANQKEIENLAIPENLENRLSKTLEQQPPNATQKRKWHIKVASLLLLFLLIGYNLDTLAYYSKKLIGFDSVMSQSLKELNEQGKGQLIDKSFTFENGTTVTLDGVMADDNQMLLFYTLSNPEGNINEYDTSFMTIKGLFKELNQQGGSGEMNEEKTEIKWIMSFESPLFYQKNLTWEFQIIEDRKVVSGEISFTLDRNKAMGHTLKSSIDKTIKFDNRSITFDSILASQTTTIIRGTVQDKLALAKDQISGERMLPSGLEIDLIANGEPLQHQGAGMGTNMNGTKFHQDFDPLPENLESLQIKIVGFVADYDTNEQVKLSKETTNKDINVKNQSVTINEVYESQEDTYITLTTEDHVLLSMVYLIIDGQKTELNNTTPVNEEKKKDGTLTYTRTLHFQGTGEDLKLTIERIRYNVEIDKVIDLPIE